MHERLATWFQRLILLSIFVCTVCVLVAGSFSEGVTYAIGEYLVLVVYFVITLTVIVSTPNCPKSIIILDLVDSYICCQTDNPDYSSNNEGICIAAFDPYINILSSYWSLIIPFVPLTLSSLLLVNAREEYKSILIRIRFYVFLICYRIVSTVD